MTVQIVSVKKEVEDLLKAIHELLQSLSVHVSTIPPTNPQEGDFWYNPVENRLYVYVIT